MSLRGATKFETLDYVYVVNREDVLYGVASIIGSVLGISIFLGVFAGISISTLLPLIVKKFNKDTAVASAGPFATIVSDVVNLIIYFIVASIILGIWG